jgi:hypothetical protein
MDISSSWVADSRVGWPTPIAWKTVVGWPTPVAWKPVVGWPTLVGWPTTSNCLDNSIVGWPTPELPGRLQLADGQLPLIAWTTV